MKKIVCSMFLLLAGLTLGAVSVRGLGAVGDGKHDDTAAIQRGISILSGRIKMMRVRTDEGWYRGNVEAPVAELYFPAGTYRISRTLFADGSVAWRGEKGTKIILEDAAQDILFCRIFRRALFDSIEFVGGKTQLQLWNRNWECASVQIRNCTFRNSADVAVRAVSRSLMMPKGSKTKRKMLPPYEVEMKDGVPVLTPNSFEKTIAEFSSSNIYIAQSEFLNCKTAFEVNNDGTLVEDCHIVANPEAEGPVIISGCGPAPNMLALWRVTAEAPRSSKKQVWILNEGFHLNCSDCVFRSAQPMLFLTQNTQDSISYKNAGCVMVNRTVISNPGKALIDVRRLPNIVKWIDNRCENGNADLFQWNVEVTERYLKLDSFRGGHKGKPWSKKHKYGFLIHGNSNTAVNLPEILKPYVHPDAPELHQAFPVGKEIAQPAAELKAADFGVTGDGKTDNSAALTKALAAAAKERKTLILPEGKIRLASTVILPPFASLRGEGMPMVIGDDLTYDLFAVKEPEQVIFRSLILLKGKRILAAELGKNKGVVAFQDCVLYESSPYSVALTGKGNACRFRASGTIWGGSGGILTDCAENEIVMCWMANNYLMSDQAFLTIRGGKLLLRSGFFVPYFAGGKTLKNTMTGESKVWELNRDMRWIDNAGGSLWISGCRGGGEAGGYDSIWQTAPGGTIYCEGGYADIHNPMMKNCMLYALCAPEKVCFAGVAGYPVDTLGVLLKKAPEVPEFPCKSAATMIVDTRK